MNVFIKREYDYALRICAYLIGNRKAGAIALSRIARVLHITRPFAGKIVYQLRRKGLLDSKQGKKGGILLNADSETLTLFDVLQAMDFDSTINECIADHTICPRSGYCEIHQYFNEQEKKLLDSFKNKKLKDFAIIDRELNATET